MENAARTLREYKPRRAYRHRGSVTDLGTYASDVAIYARISMDRTGEGLGVDRQQEDCWACVKRNSLDPHSLMGPDDVFVDNDTSAFMGHFRPQYQRLLQLVRTGVKKTIVFGHQDRLTRTPTELEELITLAEQGRVQIVSAYGDHELDLGNSNDRFVARLINAVAVKESDDKRRRITNQKKDARAKGKLLGGPRAFGWDSAKVADPWEAGVLRAAMRDVLAGASLNEIARRWNADGVPQPQTGFSRWKAHIIYRVLSNPRHAGLIAQTSNAAGTSLYEPIIVTKAPWEPIIDRATFDQVQAVLRRRGAGYHLPKRRGPFTGLLVCSHCGHTMVRGTSNTKSGAGGYRKVWRCAAGAVTIDAGQLEELVVEMTLERLDNMDLARIVRQSSRPSAEASKLSDEDAALDNQLIEAEESYLRTTSGREGISIEMLGRLQTRIERRKREIAKELGRRSKNAVLAPFAGQSGALRAAWPAMTMDQQRTIISAALGQIRILPAKRGLPRFDSERIQLVPQPENELL